MDEGRNHPSSGKLPIIHEANYRLIRQQGIAENEILEAWNSPITAIEERFCGQVRRRRFSGRTKEYRTLVFDCHVGDDDVWTLISIGDQKP